MRYLMLGGAISVVVFLSGCNGQDTLSSSEATKLALAYLTDHCPVYHLEQAGDPADRTSAVSLVRTWVWQRLGSAAGISSPQPNEAETALHLGNISPPIWAFSASTAGGKAYLFFSAPGPGTWDSLYFCPLVLTSVEVLDITPDSANPKHAAVTLIETEQPSPFVSSANAPLLALGLPPDFNSGGAGQFKLAGVLYNYPTQKTRKQLAFQRLDATGWEIAEQ